MLAEPLPITVARELHRHTAGLCWAVGGSAMMFLRGVTDVAPADLDSFTTHTDFAQTSARFEKLIGPGVRPTHDRYASDHFSTFSHPLGVQIDLIAGAAAMRDGIRQPWTFDPTRIEMVKDLPLMPLEDWRALYVLFDRPHRVAQIDAFVTRRAEPHR
jgi:hypothetical protein